LDGHILPFLFSDTAVIYCLTDGINDQDVSQVELQQFSYIQSNIYTLLKMLGCFNPILGQIWTNPAIGLDF